MGLGGAKKVYQLKVAQRNHIRLNETLFLLPPTPNPQYGQPQGTLEQV